MQVECMRLTDGALHDTGHLPPRIKVRILPRVCIVHIPSGYQPSIARPPWLLVSYKQS